MQRCLFFASNFFLSRYFFCVFLTLSWHTLTKYWKLILLCFLFNAIKSGTILHLLDLFITFFSLKFVSIFCSVYFVVVVVTMIAQFTNWFICTQMKFVLVFRLICLHKLLKRNFRHENIRVITSYAQRAKTLSGCLSFENVCIEK